MNRSLPWYPNWSARMVLLSMAVLVGLAIPIQAQTSQPARTTAGSPVIVWNREIVVIRAPVESYSPAERARLITQRILSIPVDEPEYRVETIAADVGKYSGAFITVNGNIIMGLRKEDAGSATGETFAEYTAAAVAHLKEWLAVRADQQRWTTLLRGVGFSIVATVVYLLLVGGIIIFSRRWLARQEASAAEAGKSLMVAGVNLRPFLITLAIGLFRLLAWGLALGLGYIWLTLVLGEFPYTRPWGEHLGGFLLATLGRLASGMINAIPDLFVVLVIFWLTRLVARVISAFFERVEAGLLQTPWLQPETARATRRVVIVLLWVFALIVAYPFIPGSETDVFKGVSVFVGLMVSLGSAGLVSQILGGLVVVYSRAFRTGDYIRVGEHEGTVEEIGVLSTRIRTPKRELINIPNGVLVGVTTINYSGSHPAATALAFTAVTIGYDTPWRQVHALLQLAAQRTPGVLQQPAPRVMQRALNDFYVEYQLLFAIPRPEERYQILSDLHAQIQDAFNEYGVQIMSPHFRDQPESPVVVPEEKWHAPPAPVEQTNAQPAALGR